jgi:vacuolar-type H+-ATPase subunit I/STV1
MPLSDEQILEFADPFGAFEYGDAQGDKRLGFARSIESAAIDAFLARTGKYLTNDASREAAIADATAPLLAQIAELERHNKALVERRRWDVQQIQEGTEKLVELEAQLAEARKDAGRLGIAVETAKDALESLSQWSNAYPISVFPEPDFAKAHELLQAGGMTLDAISASNMRHVVNGIGRSVEPAIAAIDAAIAQEQRNTEGKRPA